MVQTVTSVPCSCLTHLNCRSRRHLKGSSRSGLNMHCAAFLEQMRGHNVCWCLGFSSACGWSQAAAEIVVRMTLGNLHFVMPWLEQHKFVVAFGLDLRGCHRVQSCRWSWLSSTRIGESLGVCGICMSFGCRYAAQHVPAEASFMHCLRAVMCACRAQEACRYNRGCSCCEAASPRCATRSSQQTCIPPAVPSLDQVTRWASRLDGTSAC